MFCAAFGYEPNAGKDEDDGEGVSPLESADANEDADTDGDDGLHVVVDAHYRGAETMLAYHREYVADIRSEDYYVCHLQPRCYGDVGVVDFHQPICCEGQNEHCCPEKHPFVDGEHRVSPYQGTEEREIEREGKLREEAEQVAANIAHFVAHGGGTGEHEYQSAAAAHQDSERLLASDWLLQNDCGEHHGEDGHRGGDDAGIDRRSETQTDDIATLIEDESEDSGKAELHDIPQLHFLSLYEE